MKQKQSLKTASELVGFCEGEIIPELFEKTDSNCSCAENGNGRAIKGALVPSPDDRTCTLESKLQFCLRALKIGRDHVP